MTYEEFLRTKVELATDSGFDIDTSELNPALKPHQKDAVQWALHGGKRALFESFGLGKCHGKGTQILMYDCSVKNVEDVVVGDLLMGDDGTPREVLSLANGIDKLYQVTLKNGDSFTCNSAHILSCEMSNKYKCNRPGDVVNINIEDYLNLPDYARKNCYKAYKRPLEFRRKDVQFDPYVYGVWLGDGSKKRLSFTINNKDIEIVDYLNDWANKCGLACREENGRGCKTYHFSHGEKNEREYFEKDFVKGSYITEKRIYQDYLLNSREVRLELLAGLLDTDGYLIDNCYEIATKFIGLRDDILFLCRTLGLSVSHKVKTVNGVDYYRIWISGNTYEIPCKTRKRASKRKQIKNPLRYGMLVEPIGEGEYYGFTIDGNHLYMLADFTVTHNTVQELEFLHQVLKYEGIGKALLVCPLGVRQEFTRDAERILGYEPPQYVRTMAEVKQATTDIVITNYERVRDGDIDPKYFVATSLDEASVLRSFGSKTYQTFLDKFKGVKYKLVATATPSPNKYKELIHYAGYLEVMDTGQALTRFFQRDSTKANNLTLYPNQEEEFWMWLSSWALFVTKPSDLNQNYSNEGYDLPELEIRWHEIPIVKTNVVDRNGQMLLFAESSQGLSEAAKIKRESIDVRVAKMKQIVEESPDDHFVLWHDQENERHAIKKAIDGVVDIYGSLDLDTREKRVIDFSDGKIKLFATKKSLSGSGCNFQRYCHREIFLGIDYQFNDFIQAIHRCYRFLQDEKVIIDIIYMENEQTIKKELMRKWEDHNKMVQKMIDIIKEYGLNNTNRFKRLERRMGVDTVKVEGKHYIAVNDDCTKETARMEDNSIDLIHTSIPFGNHYEYSSNYADFGHNENDDDFFEQMDYLTPELLRILKPGRVAAIHVKDRVLFGNATGTGMPTIEPFHADCIKHYIKHGFQYFGMITVITDVVRENNQTYRLGWSEQCKDGSKMGVGCPEYILLFRKLPTDRSTAYADEPVTKSKSEYTRAQWQIDAHAFWRSSGDRLITKEELESIPVNQLQKVYREYSRNTVYSYEEHVAFAKKLDKEGKLPATFMVVAPGSWDIPEVWDDINRMRTLNGDQKRRNLQLHVCPLQLEIVERIINRFSNEGDLVLDPFGGLMTVPYMAVKMKRRGYGIELSPDYFRDGLGYLQAAEREVDSPTLFDFLSDEELSGTGTER